MDKSLQFKKNFIWNSLGTGLNSFNSLFLMMIVTRINGIDEAGIFTIAYSTACILYVIGTFAGRIFQVTENNDLFSDKDFIVNRIISIVLMVLCTIAFVTVRRYDTYKSTIFILLAIYKALEAFSDVLYGIMQKKDLLYKVGQSYFIKASIMIVIFFIVDYITKNLVISCISIIIVWLILILVYDCFIVSKLIKIKEEINWKKSLIIFKNGFFVFSITFLGLYVMNAPKYSIDSLLQNGMQTIFGIIVMPATAISLFGQFLIHPYLNKLVELNNKRNYIELKKLETKLVVYILAFGVASSVLAYFLGIPVLQLIYGIDLKNYNVMLTTIIIASTLYNIGMIYSNILTTMRYTFVQFVIYIVTSVIALVSSRALVKSLEIKGACMAYFIIMFCLFLLYIITEKYILKKRREEFDEE